MGPATETDTRAEARPAAADGTPVRQPTPGRPTPPRPPSFLSRARRGAALAHLTFKRVLAMLGLGVTLAGLYHFYAPIITGPPAKEPMTGNLNVAVAGLAAATGTSEDDASALSDSLFRAVREQVTSIAGRDTGLDIQVAGPRDVGTIRGSSVADRLATARELEGELRADVLVYGTVRRLPDAIEVQPEFLFAPRHVAHPEDREPMLTAVTLPPEPTGRQQLGTIRESGTSAADILAGARLRRRLAVRARAFTLFIVGLAHYTDGVLRLSKGERAERQFAIADRRLRDAERSGEWDPRVGHVLHLFLGNVALMRDAYGKAEREYRIALRFEPGYTRAEFGAAEARFHRSSGGNCASVGTDEAGLATAMRGYRRVIGRAGSAPSLLRTRAQFGLGRAAFCSSYAGLTTSWSVARAAFASVVHGRAPAAAGRAQVAGAHAGLGLLVLIRNHPGRAELLDASMHFQRAIDSTPSGPQQGALWSFLGNARARLGDRNGALKAYRTAIRLDPGGRKAYEAEVQRVLGR